MRHPDETQSRNRPSHLQQVDFSQEYQYDLAKKKSFNNAGQLDSHMEKDVIELLLHTKHKNLHKIRQRPK